MTDPKGKPGCFRERVERLPMRPRYTRVRARSANEGSATGGWSLAALGPACFPVDREDIAALPPGFGQFIRDHRLPRLLNKLAHRGLSFLFEAERNRRSGFRKAIFSFRQGSTSPR